MIANLITSIRVEKLFGLYTYRLPEEGVFSNAAILYGDNGVGKSTILRLAFHLLSTANNRSHRTALFNTDFQSLEVELASGIILSANRVNIESQRMLRLAVAKKGKVLAEWDYHPETKSENYLENEEFFLELGPGGSKRVRMQRTPIKGKESDLIPRGNKAYLSVLERHVPTTFILNADRRLDSDAVSDPSDEMELRRVMRYEEPKRINQLVVRSREIALSQAMSAAGRWVAQKAVIGTNLGSMNVHSAYTDVLHRLMTRSSSLTKLNAQNDLEAMLKQLTLIEAKTAELANYELATQLSTSEFKKALSVRGIDKQSLAAELLQPYIKSLEGRLEAVEPIYRIIDRFVRIVNDLLRDKTISFKLSHGFSINNRLGNPLTPAQLSSGEQQLLLLFCCVLTAREKPSVFMIDEPEISLNIKWQRQLVQTLLDITDGATIQFIFASHSLELLAQHRDRVVQLVDK